MSRRRGRASPPEAKVDMSSLIDLTFLLLVTFIVTLPALEQGVPIILPQAKTDTPPPTKDNKANVVTVDKDNVVYFKEKPVDLDQLEAQLKEMVAQDPDVPVLVRGDERLDYGSVMKVVERVYRSKVHRMALVTVQK